ncbi:MAG TPA: thioredoxin domain-containing protein [Allosphingosinicella sp.]|nr:thioredoxin domain-containing protein [Allosphingosinicella sp.]
MRTGYWLGAVAIAATLLAAGCKDESGVSGPANGSPVAAVAPPPGSDWTQIADESDEGGYRLGNPDAPVKLVEYASLSCPHCAEFSKEAGSALQDKYVKSGRVSWEFRPFLLFPTDPSVTLLARCQGPAPFFLLADQLYAEQEAWIGRIQQLPQKDIEAIVAMPPQQSMPKLIDATGLTQFFRMRGMPEARIAGCLADRKALDRLVEIKERGSTEYNVTGTPTFFINGQKFEGAPSWKELEPALRKALGE